jgi:hypothetical protein
MNAGFLKNAFELISGGLFRNTHFICNQIKGFSRAYLDRKLCFSRSQSKCCFERILRRPWSPFQIDED